MRYGLVFVIVNLCLFYHNSDAIQSEHVASTISQSRAFLGRYLSPMSPSFFHGYGIRHPTVVQSLLQSSDESRIKKNLLRLTSLIENSPKDFQVTPWLSEQLTQMIKFAARRDVHFSFVGVKDRNKPSSVVLQIGLSTKTPGVIIGTHLEYQEHKMNNASGIVTLLEIARVLINSSLNVKQPVYLIWYAPSVKGRFGSEAVVAHFKQARIPIAAVLQMDHTGYKSADHYGIGLADDLTDTELTAFIADLTIKYVHLPVSVVSCGNSCGDHSSWYRENYKVAYAFETIDDTGHLYYPAQVDLFSQSALERMKDYVHLGLAFAVELGD